MDRKNLEIEMHNIYGGAYTELLSGVRKRQYTARLLEDCRYDSILTKCVLARAKELANGYKTDIKVTNDAEGSNNWLRFEIEIVK